MRMHFMRDGLAADHRWACYNEWDIGTSFVHDHVWLSHRPCCSRGVSLRWPRWQQAHGLQLTPLTDVPKALGWNSGLRQSCHSLIIPPGSTRPITLVNLPCSTG
jgi:hypothetical protein